MFLKFIKDEWVTVFWGVILTLSLCYSAMLTAVLSFDQFDASRFALAAGTFMATLINVYLAFCMLDTLKDEWTVYKWKTGGGDLTDEAEIVINLERDEYDEEA